MSGIQHNSPEYRWPPSPLHPSHMTSGMSVWLLISETPCVPTFFTSLKCSAVYFQLKFCQFWECFWGLKHSFFPSYKRGRAAVFTLLSVTCTFLCAFIYLCSLEVMENTNVKKFYYYVLSLIHSVPLVVSITLYTKVILEIILSKNSDTELWHFYMLRITIIT